MRKDGLTTWGSKKERQGLWGISGMEMFYKSWGCWKGSTIKRFKRSRLGMKRYKRHCRERKSIGFRWTKSESCSNKDTGEHCPLSFNFEKFEKGRVRMSSTSVRPAMRVNISLIFFRKIEDIANVRSFVISKILSAAWNSLCFLIQEIDRFLVLWGCFIRSLIIMGFNNWSASSVFSIFYWETFM